MRQILAMVRKEIRLWLLRPGSWIIVFLLPLIFVWIVYAVFGSSGTPTVTIYAVNQDTSQEAEQVISALKESRNLEVSLLETREEADRRVGAGERMAAVVVPPGFGLMLATSTGAKVEIIVDPARQEQANIVIGLVNAALAPMMVDAEVNRSVSAGVDQVLKNIETNPVSNTGQPVNIDTLKEFFTAALKGVVSSQVQAAIDDPQVRLDVQSYTPGGQAAPGAAPEAHRPSLLDYLVPGYSLMFVFFLIPNLAQSVIEERQAGTLRRLFVAPLPRSRILFGKLLPFWLIGALQLVFVLLASKLMFGIDLGDSAAGLGIMILVSSLAMAALGVLIAAFARTEAQVGGLATVLVLAMAVVSGAMFPSIQIPGLQAITPHYWSMQGFLNIIARGMGTEGAFLPAGVLLTISAVFFTIAAVRFRFE